ncbi:MAG: cobalamin biosynthesis protein CobD/CbiB [Acidimicrobiia bacterium]
MGLAADRLFGEPRLRPHPVALLGTAFRLTERVLYADQRQAGVAQAGAGLALGASAGASLRFTALSTYIAVAGSALGDAASAVAAALEADDLDEARRALPALAGRDPADLDAAELSRATVESVAENTVDAVVAPALWGALAGPRGAMGYRAVNTLDSMFGHHSARYENFGWASARLDDWAGLVPARLTAVLVAGVRPTRALAVARTVRADAGAHPSPNAGVAEAAFAAALGLSLGGTNRYGDRVEVRPTLGDGRRPDPADIARAVRLSVDVTSALAGLLTGLAVLPAFPGHAGRSWPPLRWRSGARIGGHAHR